MPRKGRFLKQIARTRETRDFYKRFAEAWGDNVIEAGSFPNNLHERRALERHIHQTIRNDSYGRAELLSKQLRQQMQFRRWYPIGTIRRLLAGPRANYRLELMRLKKLAAKLKSHKKK